MQGPEFVPRRPHVGLAVLLAAIIWLGAIAAYGNVALAGAPEGGWLSFKGGHLVYGHDAQGNRIPDFSYAGYGNGGVPIPEVPARAEVSPPEGGADATALIQGALDQVSALPLDSHGFRGAVVLERGTYKLYDAIGNHEALGASGTLVVR